MWRCGIDAEQEADFEGYVRARGPALARAAKLLVGDVHLGEDLAQDVLARAAMRWARIRAMDNPDAYLQRALVNAAVSWRRRRSWGETPVAAVPERQSQEGLGYDDSFLKLLAHLPPRQRAVMVLRYYFDQSEAQIAQALGVSAGTVKSQHAKAASHLRQLINSEPVT